MNMLETVQFIAPAPSSSPSNLLQQAAPSSQTPEPLIVVVSVTVGRAVSGEI
jgi:hypothetical protein